MGILQSVDDFYDFIKRFDVKYYRLQEEPREDSIQLNMLFVRNCWMLQIIGLITFILSITQPEIRRLQRKKEMLF